MGKTRKKLKSKRYLSTQVISALKANDVGELKSLKESGHSLGLCDRDGNNLLHLAILEYSFEDTSTIAVFEYLLTLDEIDKDGLNAEHCFPLMYAFGYTKDNPEYAIKLIESGCSSGLVYPNGDTSLHLAVRNNWPEVVELLIEKGFDVDEQNDNQQTPLHVALLFEHTDLIWMLLFYGADPNITFSGFTEYDSCEGNTSLTFFDLIHKDEAFLSQFSNFDKNFGLLTYIETMELGAEVFYDLLKNTCEINYTYDDLTKFAFKFYVLNSKMLKNFVKEFGYVIEEVFDRCCLDDLFTCPEATCLEKFAHNLFILLESDIVSILIDKLSESGLPLLLYLVRSFHGHKENLDLLTQLLCCFLSHGAVMTPEAMNELFFSFGYCDLFKTMLHMNITHTRRQLVMRHFWPTVIYDIDMDIDALIYRSEFDTPTGYTLEPYFTTSAFRLLRIPSLVELARNASRKYILKKYEPKNCMQFYTILHRLPIAEVHKRIISFERQLYC